MEVFFLVANLLKSTKKLDFYLNNFMEYSHLKDLSKKTMSSYESTLLLFFKYVQEEKGIDRIENVKRENIEEYIIFTKECGKYSMCRYGLEYTHFLIIK